MVVVVAVGLALTSISLKSRQERNVELEKKQNILASFGVDCSRANSEKMYEKYIKEAFAIDYKGNKIPGVDGFKINLEEEQRKPVEERKYPVFKAQKQSQTIYIFPVRGKGLWGPIWGYVALKDDFNTIYGVTFDHKSETPGLGAQITTKKFQSEFVGKKIFDDMHKFTSVLVLKHGKADKNNPHQVDGLSGATLTSRGVSNMLYNSLKAYENFFNKKNK
jgi:Na+-transporting NADH:ubiquinone oxidoreductase subunit C